jgi:hypothetical protein
MKNIFKIILVLFLSSGSLVYGQQTMMVNDYLVLEQNGVYYNILGNDTLEIISDVISLIFNSNTSANDKNAFDSLFNLQEMYKSPTGWINYKLHENSDIIMVLEDILNHPNIETANFNRYLPYSCSEPNEFAYEIDKPFMDSSWYQDPWWYGNPLYHYLEHQYFTYSTKSAGHRLMKVDSAWQITTGSPDIVIGIIDSGTNIDHEDIGIGDAPNDYHILWEHPNSPGVYGWNFVNNDSDISDVSGHGTMIASIACAKTNNQTGAFGVAGGWGKDKPGVSVMTLVTNNANGNIIEYTLSQALDYAVQNGARIVNMSFGGRGWYNAALDASINLAHNNYDCIMVAAAGHQKDVEPVTDGIIWPASHEHVLAVGISIFGYVDGGEEVSYESHAPHTYEGSELFLLAHGQAYYCSNNSYDSYIWRNCETQGTCLGTSGTAAYVSGIIGLILSANPDLSKEEVITILRNSADKIDPYGCDYDLNGHSINCGFGRINAFQAVLEAISSNYVEISTIEEWDYPKYQTENIAILAGGQLTIKSNLYMKEGTKIVVQRGAKLLIDGGVISATNAKNQWTGIEVWGNSNQPQLVEYQGFVKINNGGTIKHSELGIYTNRPDDNNPTLWMSGYTGGIVQGNKAKFINNKIDLQFFPYTYTSVSGFSDSYFLTLPDFAYFHFEDSESGLAAQMVNLDHIQGVGFSNCSFEQNVYKPTYPQSYPWKHYRSGIKSINSHVVVKGRCVGTTIPCDNWEYGTFKGLHRGIWAISNSPNTFVDIRNVRFDKNFRGLYLSGISDARITSNEFIINTPFEEDGGYGLYLNACNGYWVEDNEFLTGNTYQTGVGIIVNDSGDDPNEIYRNRFIKLEQGISAQGYNRDSKTNNGLQILCNDFMNTGADILVANPYEKKAWGIAAWQGDNTYMAGNLFHHHTAVDYNDINNEGEHITYFYPSNNTDWRVKPEEYTLNTVTLIPIPSGTPWDYAFGCPCQLAAGGGGQTEELKQRMAESTQQSDDLQESLGLMIDDGDTEELHWDVQMSTSPQAMQLYDELMGASPWLSDTVVSASISKEDVFIDAMLRDIMVANPHTAKSDKLMEELDQRWTPLPEYMKAQILQGKNMVSAREQTEALLARQKLNKTRAINSLARIWHDDADSLIWLWEGDNSLSSKYKLAFLHLELGQHAQGISILNNIPVQMNLSAGQQASHQQVAAVYDILASLSQEGKSILEADSLQILTLLDIEEEANGIAGVYARNVLLTLQMLAYDEPILLPDLMKSRAAAEAYRKLLETRPPKNLGVFPIPARDYIVVDYQLDAGTKGMIEFTDATGRLVHTLKVNGPINQQLIDTRGWKPGWYIATLKTQAKTLKSVKFIISD